MRIALMPSAYAPAVGGVEVLTARLAHQLQSLGHTVVVWAPLHGAGTAVAETIDGIEVRRFAYPLPRAHLPSLVGSARPAAAALRALRRAAAEFRPDLLHVQCFSSNGAYATVLSTVARIPLVVTLQGETVMDDHDIYDQSALLRGSLRLGLRRAAAVTGCSGFTLDDSAARFGLHRQQARVIFNGVDLEETPPEPLDLPFDRYVLGLGRVVRKKGFDLLLRAFAEVAARHPGVGLVLGGSGAELEPLRALAVELGVADRVHLPGSLNRGQVCSAMAGAATFVMPSRVEPFGIVALEGWRAGVPVVVTSRGGAGEFVRDGVEGLVVDPFDTTALATALDRVLGSPDLASTLVASAAVALPGFTWERITEQYLDVYAGVAAGAGRG